MLNNIIRSALLLVLAAAISACGFHLRGNIPLNDNIKNMFVSAPEGPFKDQLEKILTTSGAQLSATDAGADVLLVVTKFADVGREHYHFFFQRIRFSHLEPPNPTFQKPIFLKQITQKRFFT